MVTLYCQHVSPWKSQRALASCCRIIAQTPPPRSDYKKLRASCCSNCSDRLLAGATACDVVIIMMMLAVEWTDGKEYG